MEEQVLKGNGSKYFHITLNDASGYFLFKCNSKNVLKSSFRYSTLSGQTKGEVINCGFFDMKKRIEKVKPDIRLQNSSYYSSSIKKINGKLFFPEFRAPSAELIAQITEIEAEISAKQEQLQHLLNDKFDEQSLLLADDIFKMIPAERSTEHIETVLKQLKYKE